ncbi:hypothetical protein BJX70DRAFT_359980 [Aspergillus crustosus]
MKQVFEHFSARGPLNLNMSGAGTTPLIMAVRNSNVEALRLLIDEYHVRNFDAHDQYSKTAGMWAIRNQDDGIIQMLQQHVPDRFFQTLSGEWQMRDNGHTFTRNSIIWRGLRLFRALQRSLAF